MKKSRGVEGEEYLNTRLVIASAKYRFASIESLNSDERVVTCWPDDPIGCPNDGPIQRFSLELRSVSA
jgi:hypothetical protein